MIKVHNLTRRVQVFNLPHDTMCGSECSCMTHEHRQTDHNRATGEIGMRVLERKLSGSAHIQPGTFASLPTEALWAPEVAGAVARGEVRIETVPDQD